MTATARLLIKCPDTPGIVAEVTSFLFGHGANIITLDQYTSDDGAFFMRLEFETPNVDLSGDRLAVAFG